MKDTLGVLLAGGAGERLYPLTRDRAKPAVTFGGNYRIIDITLSNCINSDLRRVYILTQYKALSLNRHIREGWGSVVARELGEFIEILPPMKRVSENWYLGTADAVYQNIYSIGSEQCKHVIILSGHHILPRILDQYKIYSFNFIDENMKEAQYWRDVGTLEAYYEANMDLVAVSPVFNLYDAHWPIRTHQRQSPPAKFVFGEPGRTGTAIDSIVCPGCILSGGYVRNCVLSPDVRVNSYTEVDTSIIFSHVNIGRHCRIRRAIIDRDVHIPEWTVIRFDPSEDAKNYVVTETGITIVTRDYSLFESPVAVDYFTSQ